MPIPSSPAIDLVMPVDWANPINRGLVSWHLVMPGNNGGGVFVDITKHGHDGILTNMDPAIDWVGSNRHGGIGALDFDDAGDFVDIDHAVVDALPLTMSCWFKANNATAILTPIVLQIAGSAGSIIRILLRGNVGGDPVQAQFQNSGSAIISTTTGYEANKWHLATAVYVDATEMRVYLDGGSEGIVVGLSLNLFTPTATHIGGLDGLTEDMDGQIDDVRIWNRALTADEIREVYLDSLGG